MKLYPIVLALVTVSTSFAASYKPVYSCRNIWINEEINNNLFEEGLGVYGREDVDDDSETSDVAYFDGVLDVSIGQMSYDAKEDSIVVKKRSGGGKEYLVTPKNSKDKFLFAVGADKKGFVMYQAEGVGRMKKLVELDCSKK